MLFIATGTFSSVYKAVDIKHPLYHNTWCICCNRNSKMALVSSEKAGSDCGVVALKRIYVTSSPERIYHEIDFLKKLKYIIYFFP